MHYMNRKKYGNFKEDFLERETRDYGIDTHEGDVYNEIMNKDILKRYDKLNTQNYVTPLDVVHKYDHFVDTKKLTIEPQLETFSMEPTQ